MLCDRLLGCGHAERAALPRAWLAGLLRASGAEGSGELTHLRRSAGLPFAMLAVLYSEQTLVSL